MGKDPERSPRPLGRVGSLKVGLLRKKSLSERKSRQLDVLSSAYQAVQERPVRPSPRRQRSKSFSGSGSASMVGEELEQLLVRRHSSMLLGQGRRSTRALAVMPEEAAMLEQQELPPGSPSREGQPVFSARLSTLGVGASSSTSFSPLASLRPSMRASVRMSMRPSARSSIFGWVSLPDGLSQVALPASMPPSQRPSEWMLRPSIAAIPPRASAAYDRLSTLAVVSSPPYSLGSELPTARTEGEGSSPVPGSAWGMGGGPLAPSPLTQDGSRPGSSASHATFTSQHSGFQASNPGSFSFDNQPKKRVSTRTNFFRGDMRSLAHQMQKASVLASKAKAGSEGLRLAYRASRRGTRDTVSSEGGRQSWGSAVGSVTGPGNSIHSSSSLGDAAGRSPQFRNYSALEKLRGGMSPAAIRHMASNQSGDIMQSLHGGWDARASVTSRSSDLQSVLSMGGQVLEAANSAFHDDYQRRSIVGTLGGDNLNKRVAWMNKVLGSQYVDDDMVMEEEDDSHKNDVLFHPNSPFRARWDIVVTAVIVYQIAVMPVRVVWGDNEIGMLFGVEMLLSVLLCVDVIISFHTGWETEGDIIMDKHRVRRHYLRSWFVPDLISSFPYDVLSVMVHTEDPKSYKAISFRAVRFLALLRWPRLWRYINKWQDMLALDSILLKLSKYWLALLMFVHAGGCLVALQAFLQRNNPNSFFNRTDFTSPPEDPPLLMPRSPFVQYTYSLFRSSSGLLACGWGMSYPVPVEEVLMMLVVQLVGSVMQLIFQAAILTLVRTYDRSTANYMQRAEMIKDFFSRYDIPAEIRKRTMVQQLARHTNRRLMRDEVLLKEMAPSMRVDLQVHLAANVLRLQPIFSTLRPVVARAVAAELVQGRFAPGDTIFYKGEMADCMYFVAEGLVRIVDPDNNNKLLTHITRGSYFGEFALLQGERGVRTAAAEAGTMTLLFSLSRKTFYRIAAHYPELLDALNIIAAARAAVNSNQTLNTQDLLRIKASRSSYLMNTCRAAVANAILEEDEDPTDTGGADKAEAESFDGGPAVG